MTLACFTLHGKKEIVEERKPLALSMGNFDGVHLGHQELIRQTVETARTEKIYSAVLTFDPHPSFVVAKAQYKKPLMTLDDRIQKILSLGVDVVIVQKFSAEFACISPTEFAENFLAQEFSIQQIFVGFNFAFGKGRTGNVEFLQKIGEKTGWKVNSCSPQTIEGVTISSSTIRTALEYGFTDLAEKLLGVAYTISGQVVHGQKLASQLGFPTANIGYKDCLLPQNGVYSAYIHISPNPQKYPAIVNVGTRPTVSSELKIHLEAHLLDFKEDIYGKMVTVHFKKFIRNEKKFSGIEELKKQIVEDISQAAESLTQGQS